MANFYSRRGVSLTYTWFALDERKRTIVVELTHEFGYIAKQFYNNSDAYERLWGFADDI